MKDVLVWIGAITVALLVLRLLHGFAVTFIVARVGWTRLHKQGFWRALAEAVTG